MGGPRARGGRVVRLVGAVLYLASFVVMAAAAVLAFECLTGIRLAL